MPDEALDSRAPYIILCSFETEMLVLTSHIVDAIGQQVNVACQASREMCCYLGTNVPDTEFTTADTAPLSDKMHEMQSILKGDQGRDFHQLLPKVVELMVMVKGLHVKFSGY